MTVEIPRTLAALSWPELSLVFFIALFAAIVLRLVFSRSTRWQQDARIPLDDTKPVDDRRRPAAANDGAKPDA